MKLYYPITVDLYNLYPLKKMDAQQDNTGRGALVTLTAAGQVIEPDNETVTLWAKKPDGTVSYLACTVTDGKIKLDFTNQMLAVSGLVQVELQMVEGEDNITTPIFTVEVHPSNIDDDAVESQNEFTALQAAVSAINTALQEVDELKKTGLKGDPGEPGKDGEPGAAATIEVGTVEAGQPGADPQVTNSGSSTAAVFNFVLPRGETGPAGADGKEQVYFGAFADFPTTGNSEMLYVDTSNTAVLVMYRWNGTAYVPSGGGAADLDVVAQEFDATKAYTKGTYVIYSGGLYCFTSDKAAGAWDASVVTPTTVGEELNGINAKIVQTETETATATLTKNVTVQNSVNLLKKNGKIVNLMLGINANNATLTQYQGNIVGSIPSGFFPSKEVWMSVISQAKGYYVFRISPAGEIIIQPFDAKASNNNIFFINLTWILD